MVDPIASDKIPVTVLTGYLGAGKTTLLNRILSEPHGRKFAVIVNEFGQIGIDNDLIVGADEEIFEMNNGCLCCTVRGDLIRIIEGLLRRAGRFDAIIVETTGLADPAPVAQTFFVDEIVGRKTKLDAVVTVADAQWLERQLHEAPEAKNQIAFADVILLNKTDLVSAASLRGLEERLRALNPYATLHSTPYSAVTLSISIGFSISSRRSWSQLMLITTTMRTMITMTTMAPTMGQAAWCTITTKTCAQLRLRPSGRLIPISSFPGSRTWWPKTARTFCAPRAFWLSRTTPSGSSFRGCT